MLKGPGTYRSKLCDAHRRRSPRDAFASNLLPTPFPPKAITLHTPSQNRLSDCVFRMLSPVFRGYES